MFGEGIHNYPEGYEEKPWCPYTQLVQIGVSLAGLEVTPDTFCYQRLENARYSGGAIHYFEGGDFYPEASCSKATKKLIEQLRIVSIKVEMPSEQATINKMDKTVYLSSKIEVADDYKEKKKVYDQRKMIIDRWRKVVFETSYSTTADEKNVHFRQLESSDDLTEEEIINNVKQFTEALQKIVGFKQNTIGWHIGEVKNCDQAPQTRHINKV